MIDSGSITQPSLRRLVTSLLIAGLLNACTGANGKPHPAVVAIAEAWKFTKDVALAACAIIERPETMVLATVTLPDYGPVAVSVARLACSLITSRPDAVAVVVSADGSGSAIVVTQASIGGGE